MAGQNDLNLLLKAQVVKLRAELDVKGSLPKIRSQVNDITNKLKGKPVKLDVRLDYKIGELRRQMNMLQTALNTAKTLKPIKLKVDIDVAGSASKIKKQLQDIYKIVGDFNKKYGDQVKKMQQQFQSANIKSTPTSAMLGAFDMKLYAQQIKDARTMMKDMFGKGDFKSFEFKDAEGNLRGFIAQLEKANGVVQKIRYEWDEKAGKFMPINQQTINGIEKHVNKASQSLRSLYSDITKLQEGRGQNNLFKEYENLEKRISHGTLTQDAVKALQRQIKEEQVLQQSVDKTNKQYIERKELIRQVNNAMKLDWKETGDVGRRDEFKTLINDIKKSNGHLDEHKLKLREINDEIKKQTRSEKELQENTKRRMQIISQLRKIERQTPSSDKTSQGLLKEIQYMAERARHAKDWINIQKRMNTLQTSNDNSRELQKSIQLQDKLEQKIRQLGMAQNKTTEQINRNIKSMQSTAMRGYEDLNRMYYSVDNQLNKLRESNKKAVSESKVLLQSNPTSVLGQKQASEIRSAVNSRDVESLQKYIGQIYKGRVETVKMEQTTDSLGRAVDRMKVKMAGAGKTVKTYMVDLDRANGELRQVQQGMDYNANRNLGVMEQLRIAMARVPVWMTAMTAFYGTIRSVRAMTNEILQVDKAITELKRVVSDGINIDRIFQGAIDLSAKLGNNVHDVMQTMNDFARTYGEFNERQLLAITNTATLMSNVSDISAQEAGETLVATMNAFNIEAEESVRIVDAFNEVDNNFAVSTQQLAEGMSKTASTARTFGVTMEESVGHITAISSVTMESGKVIGNSLKTIYSRITTMSEAQDVLEGVGVALYNIGADGQQTIKPVNEILSSLADKWFDLTDAERQNISVKVAGRYQLSRFLALMNNWGTAVDATSTALTSQGSAMRENRAYLESFEARINKLKNAFTEMSLSIGDAVLSGAMKGVIDLLTTLAETAVLVVEKVGALPVVFGAIGGIMTSMGVFNKLGGDIVSVFQLMGSEFKKSSAGMRGFRGTIAGTTGAMKALAVTSPAVAVGIRSIGTAMKSVLASTGVGLLFVGIGIALEGLIKKYEDYKQAEKDLEESNNQLVDSYRNTAGGLEALVDKHTDLTSKLKENGGNIEEGTEAYNEYLAVNQELAEKMPNMVEYVDSKGVAHLKEAEALKENVEYAKKLSEEYAKLTMIEFEEKTKERISSISDLNDKIEELSKRIKDLGELEAPNTIKGDFGKEYKIDLEIDKKIQKSRIETVLAQQEIQGEIQKINGLVGETIIASLEASGKLQFMSDSGLSATEKIITNNEKFLREIAFNDDLSKRKREKLLEAKVEELFGVGEKIGMLIADKSEELVKNVTDTDEIDRLKMSFDTLLNTLPDTFFSLESLDNVDQFAKNLDGVLEVSNKISSGSGNFDGIVKELEALGISANDAERMTVQLGYAFENDAIKKAAMAKDEMGELNGSLDDYIEKVIEAVDASEALFGYSNEETSALKSHLEMLKAMKELGKEGTDVWKRSVEDVSDFFGVTGEYVEKNINKFTELTTLMNEWSPSFDEKGKLEEDAKKKFKRIEELAEELNIELTIDEEGKIKQHTDDVNKNTEAKKKNKEATEETKNAIDELWTKFDQFKNSANSENRIAYFDLLKSQLNEVDGQILVTQDKAGNLKLVMADGSNSPYLNGVMSQLGELGAEMSLTKDEAGNLKLAFTHNGETYFIDGIGESLDDANVKIVATGDQMDELDKKKVKPEIDVDFDKLSGGLKDVDGSLKELDGAFSKLESNVKKISSLEGALKDLAGIADKIKDAFASLFSDSKGDLDNLRKEADNAKDSVKKLESAIKDIKNIASRIDAKGFKDLEKASKNAKDSIDKFKDALVNVGPRANDMAGDVKSATSKVKGYIENQEKAVKKLGDRYSDTASDISSTFGNMSGVVASRTDTMIGKHNTQANAVQRLASSAREAQRAILSLNSSANSSMATLDRYIAKANKAIQRGNSVPKAPSSGGGVLGRLFGAFGLGSNGSNEGASTTSIFSASTGDSGGSEGSGGTGTSGTIQQPQTLLGAVNLDGVYDFMAFANKDNDIADLYTWSKEERQAQALEHSISMIEAKMNAMTESTAKYRNALKQVISQTQKLIAIEKKDLSLTKSRQKSIEKQLKTLQNTSKHTKAQREKYNKLQQEYEQNISKIQKLELSLENAGQSIRSKSTEIFSDWINEVQASYDKIINSIKKSIDNLDFKMEVLSLTDGDNVKKQTDLLVNKVVQLVKEEKNLVNLQKELNTQLKYAIKHFGKNSEEAKKIQEALDGVNDSMNSVTLEMLKTEKSIKDIRADVADKSIDMLKKYYREVARMATDAIEKEKKSLQDAHSEKMKLYDEEIDKINSVYDDRIKKMDEEASASEYQEKLDEKSKQKAELLNKIRLLSTDKSIDGKKRLHDAEKELTALEEEMAVMQAQRKDELLRAELESQKQKQIEAVNEKKQLEETELQNKLERLEAEKEAMNQYYNDIIENDRYWAQMRDEFIAGNFTKLNTEMEKMKNVLKDLDKGVFSSLEKGFTSISDEVKKQISEINKILIDNLNFEVNAVTKKISDLQKALKLETKKAEEAKKKATAPKTPAKTSTSTSKSSSSSSSKSSSSSSSSKATPKAIKVGGKAKVSTKNANAYLDSYGKQVKPWASQAKAAGVGYGDSLHVVNTRGDYVALAKKKGVSNAIAWLKKKDLVGLRSGGFTGDWAGDDGKVAMLHKKELVLNERQTSDILDTAKIMEKAKNAIPKLKRGSINEKLATASQTTSTTYGDINVTVQDGNKKKAKEIASEILGGIKKRGK